MKVKASTSNTVVKIKTDTGYLTIGTTPVEVPSDLSNTYLDKVKKWIRSGVLQEVVEEVNYPVTTVTANYTITDNDYVIYANASGGSITVTLPSAENRGGRAYCIIKTNSETNKTVTVSAQSGETVKGSASVTLTAQYDRIEVVSNGDDAWLLRDEYIAA